jgi:hypothetical protein
MLQLHLKADQGMYIYTVFSIVSISSFKMRFHHIHLKHCTDMCTSCESAVVVTHAWCYFTLLMSGLCDTIAMNSCASDNSMNESTVSGIGTFSVAATSTSMPPPTTLPYNTTATNKSTEVAPYRERKLTYLLQEPLTHG